MTTIAYHHKDRQIAYDSRCTSGGLILTDSFDKKMEHGKGIYFLSGSTSDFNDFCQEFENGKKVKMLSNQQGYQRFESGDKEINNFINNFTYEI